jgi:hypothetical protein
LPSLPATSSHFCVPRSSPAFNSAFIPRVELDQFHVSVHHGVEARWGIWATGQGLRIWPPNQTGGDHPLEVSVQSLPLIKLDEFAFHVPLRFKTATLVHIAEVQLKDLDIHVPPRSERNKETGLRSAIDTETNGTSQPAPSQNSYGGVHFNVQVDRVDCDQAQLILETDKPNKLPLGFFHFSSAPHAPVNGPVHELRCRPH